MRVVADAYFSAATALLLMLMLMRELNGYFDADACHASPRTRKSGLIGAGEMVNYPFWAVTRISCEPPVEGGRTEIRTSGTRFFPGVHNQMSIEWADSDSDVENHNKQLDESPLRNRESSRGVFGISGLSGGILVGVDQGNDGPE
ncbi:hypothetical protein BS47DRAFT_1365939 [Hydnum rufescens UP504]|uniref:Uncharacterized protein n=1 Tax=Hydnum rufescens UP504 TaxID=1448309 RepID=A0A9P6DNZ2_9AGAM|nr:hypothetical protein BS47DRAFT_1365939 [Hydnum rufescens UP504]